MKKYFIFLFIIGSLFAQNHMSNKKSFGLMIMGGGRYDDLRMCVGSPAGIKGGPIADIMFITQFEKSDNSLVSLNIPVFRPILFGAAFDMLQFEPEVILEKKVPLKNGKDMIYGPGIGLSFHYGPDYMSDLDNRSDNFFAIGPMINYSFGMIIDTSKRKKIAIKTFYIPLFGKNSNNGTVIGASLQYYHIFR